MRLFPVSSRALAALGALVWLGHPLSAHSLDKPEGAEAEADSLADLDDLDDADADDADIDEASPADAQRPPHVEAADKGQGAVTSAQDAAQNAADARGEADAAATSTAPAATSQDGDDGAAVEQARIHFEQGVDYYAEGDFRAALIELQRAYQLHRTFKLLYNLGQVAYELRDYAGAERYYRDYLAKGGSALSPERRRQVQQELARLRTRVATLHLRSEPTGARFRVDDRDILHPEGSVRVSAGRRHVHATKPGYAPVQRVLDVTGGEELDVTLGFGPPLVAGRVGLAEASQGSSSRWPWVTGIAAGVLTAASVGVGYSAYRDVSAREDALDEFTARAELDQLRDQARTKALVADALLGAALVSAAATLVLIVIGDDKPDEARALRMNGRGVSAQLAF